jgi:hypothetical protein
MNSKTLVVSDPSLIAEFVRQSEFEGLLEKRFAVPEDYVAVLFRNGKIIDAYKGVHFSVGGLVNGLKGIIGGSSAISLMIGDLKPFQVRQTFRALSKDKVEVVGVAALELQINPEQPQNVLGLMSGRKSLSRADVLERLRPHLSDRIVEAVIGRHDGTDIRGNIGLQDKIQADIMLEAERVLGDLGLICHAVSMEWAVNAAERRAIDQAEAAREDEDRDAAIKRAIRQAEQMNDVQEFAIRTGLAQQKLELLSEQEFAQLILAKEVEFIDLREAAQRRQQLEALNHEVEVLSQERRARMQNELADAQQIVDLTERKLALTRVELEIEKLTRTERLNLEKLEALTRLEINRVGNADAAANISTLQDIEFLDDKRRAELDEQRRAGDHARRMEQERLARQSELEILRLKATMSPEQLLAHQAGLSPEVAMVLAEQAKAQAASSAQSMELMREMVTAAKEARVSSEEQARAMFKMGMDGAVGVSFGAGGKESPPASAADAAKPAAPLPTTVECPKCGRVNDAKARFCVGCGHQLRA